MDRRIGSASGERLPNFASTARAHLSRSPSRRVLDDHYSITYGELDERVLRLCGRRLLAVCCREERCCFLMHDNNDCPFALIALSMQRCPVREHSSFGDD